MNMKLKICDLFFAMFLLTCLFTACNKTQEDFIFTKKLVKTNYNGKDATAFSYDAQGRMSVIKSISAVPEFEATLDYSQQGKVMETIKLPLGKSNILNELNTEGLVMKTFTKYATDLRYDTANFQQITYDNDLHVIKKASFSKNQPLSLQEFTYQNGKLMRDISRNFYQPATKSYTETVENTYEYQTNIKNSKGNLSMDFRGKLSSHLPSRHFETKKSTLNNTETFHTLAYDHSYEVDTEGYVVKEVQKVSLFAKSNNITNFTLGDSVRTFIYVYQ
jgi:hypothetical protein